MSRFLCCKINKKYPTHPFWKLSLTDDFHSFSSHSQYHWLEQCDWQFPFFYFFSPSCRSAISMGFQLAGFKCDVNENMHVASMASRFNNVCRCWHTYLPPSFLQCAVLTPSYSCPFHSAIGEPVRCSSCSKIWIVLGRHIRIFARFHLEKSNWRIRRETNLRVVR